MNQGSFYWNFSSLCHLCWSTNCTSRWVLVDRFCWFFHQTALAISEPVLFLNLPFKLIFFLSDLFCGVVAEKNQNGKSDVLFKSTVMLQSVIQRPSVFWWGILLEELYIMWIKCQKAAFGWDFTAFVNIIWLNNCLLLKYAICGLS